MPPPIDIPPVIANPDTVVAAAGTGPIALGIAAPTDPDNGPQPLTITLDTVPGYGTVEYFDGSNWTVAGNGTVLTAEELASLRYTPPASGEHGGSSIAYSVFDGVATVHGTTEVSVFVDSAGPADLFFSARDSDTRNADLYTVDAAGNLTSAPLNPDPGFGSLAGENGGFHQFAGNLYFMAFTPMTSDVLFKLDPNGSVTPVQGSEPGDGFFQNTQENAHYTEFAGSLYFRAISATAGDELIKLNADGTTHSFDINPGGNGSAAGFNGGLTEFDGSLYFSGFPNLTSQSHGTPDLIELDAAGNLTVISTRTDPSNGSDAGVDGGFVVFNHALYFHAFSDAVGDALFRLDAGSTTPVLVDPAGSHINHAFTGIDAAFHEFNGSLYFNDYSVDVGNQTLIRLDAGGAFTGLTFNGEALQFAGSLGGFVDFAGSTYFVATTSSEGTELFKLDAAGVVSQITDVVGDAFGDNLVGNFVQFAGSLYFDAYNGGAGDNLYKLSAGGVLTTVDLGTGGGTTNAGVEGGFQEFAGSLYFSSYTTTGYELVRLDADGTVTPYDINPDDPLGSLHNSEAGKDGGFGIFPHTILNGGPGKDIVVGGDQNETLNGGPQADILAGRGGNDVLTGGDGPDTFAFSASGAANVDVIKDYNFAAGDKIDVSDLIGPGFGPDSNVADFVRVIPAGDDLRLQVDGDGPDNGHNWADVAILEGANTAGENPVSVVLVADPVIAEPDVFNVQTVALTNGGNAVTWTQTGADDGSADLNVYGRVYDAAGHQVGAEFEVSSANALDDSENIVTALDNGHFAVTWQSAGLIETRVFDANGNGGAEHTVAPVGDNTLARVVELSNGDYAALYSRTDVADANVYVRILDPNGVPVVNELSVTSPSNNGLPDILHGGGGIGPSAIVEFSQIVRLEHGFAVTWTSFGHDSGDATNDVMVRVFDETGGSVTSEIVANDSPVSGLQDTDSEIVALGGDDFAVQWVTDDSSGGRTVHSRIFHSSDYAAGSPVRDDANAASDVLAQPTHIAALANGGYVSLWGQYDTLDANNNVFVQVYDHNGNIAAGSQAGGIEVNLVTGAPTSPAQVIALADGGFAVMYESNRVDGGTADNDVYVRTFAADGTALSGEVRVNPSNNLADDPEEMVALPGGNFAVVYRQVHPTANGQYSDIVVQLVAADGSLQGAPLTVHSTPADAGNASDISDPAEFRMALSSHGFLFATSDFENIDGGGDFYSLAVASLGLAAPAFAGVGPGSAIDGIASIFDIDVTVSDGALDLLNGGNGDYAGATLTLARAGGASSDDAFGFDPAVASFTVSGSHLQSGGLNFATFSSSGGSLTIEFTSTGTAATSALVDDVLQHVTYLNQNPAHPASVDLDYTFDDGLGGSPGTSGSGVDTETSTVTIFPRGVDQPGVVHSTGDEMLLATGGDGLAAPVVAALTTGRFAFLWASTDSLDPFQRDVVHLSLRNADGSVFGSDSVVTTTADSLSFKSPAAIGLHDGRFAVAWANLDAPSSSDDTIQLHLFNPDGSTASSDIAVAATSGHSETAPALAELTSGHLVVAWTDNNGDADISDPVAPVGIRLSILDSDGNAIAADIAVNTKTAGAQSLASVAALAGDDFVVTWVDDPQTGVPGENSDIRAQIFDGTGAKVGSEFVVNSTTTDYQRDPFVVTLADGRFLIAWTDESKTGGDTDGQAIRARIFDANGTESVGEFLVNPTTAGNQAVPAIEALPDGGFLATWDDESGALGDPGRGIYGQLYNANGTVRGDPFRVNSHTNGFQSLAATGLLADGRSFAGWDDQGRPDAGLPFSTAIAGQFLDTRQAGVHLAGTVHDDDYIGSDFDDGLTDGAGNDRFDGGAGIDTAVFAGKHSDYSARLLGNGFIEISDLRPGSPDGTDQFIRVEQFIFADGSFGAGQVLTGVIIIGTNHEDFINAHHTAPGQPLPTLSDDTIYGRGGGDTLYGLAGNDRIFGGGGADQIFGGPGDDRLVGGVGNDLIFGGVGNDVLIGGGGDDQLFGGPGRDRLNGGRGHNRLNGGPGADRFVFATLDTLGTIVNFTHGVDKFELAANVFKSIHHIAYVAATGAVLFDADGPGGAAPVQFAALAPHLHITASDFLFA